VGRRSVTKLDRPDLAKSPGPRLLPRALTPARTATGSPQAQSLAPLGAEDDYALSHDVLASMSFCALCSSFRHRPDCARRIASANGEAGLKGERQGRRE